MEKIATLLHRAAARTLSAWEGARATGPRSAYLATPATSLARTREAPFRRKVLFEALEPRVLLSADLLPGSLPAVLQNQAPAATPVVDVASPPAATVVGSSALPLTAVGPIEAGVKDSGLQSGVFSGQPGNLPNEVTYTVNLATYQTISLAGVVDDHGVNGVYSVVVELRDSAGSVVQSAQDFESAQIQMFTPPIGGSYVVALRVEALGQPAGDQSYPPQIGWHFTVAVDAAIESESVRNDGSSNGSTSQAEPLNASRLLPLPGASRTAVVGHLTPNPSDQGRTDTDVYRVDLAAGESLQLETTLTANVGFLQLLDNSGQVVANAVRTGANGQWDGPLGLPAFTPLVGGIYYIKLDLYWDPNRALTPIVYTLVVARNTSLDPDRNTELGLAASQLGAIRNSQQVGNAPSPDAAAPAGVAVFDATVTAATVLIDVVPILDGTAGAGPFDPQVQVLDGGGNVLTLTQTSPPLGQAGWRYSVDASLGARLRIQISSSNDGQFLLQVQGAAGANPAPAVQSSSLDDGLAGSFAPWQSLSISEAFRADLVGKVELFDAADVSLGLLDLYPWTNDSGASFQLPTGLAAGSYRLVAPAGTFTDLTNQGSARFEVSFTVDDQRPLLLSSLPQDGGEIDASQTIALQFSEAIVDYGQVGSFYNAAGEPISPTWHQAWSADNRTLTITVDSALAEGSYELRFPNWALRDRADNDYDANPLTPDIDALVLHFAVDQTDYAMPAFAAREPLGSLVYSSSRDAALSSAVDTDDFTFTLAAGQVFTPVLSSRLGQAANTLPQLQLEVIDPNGLVVATSATSAAGRALMIPDMLAGIGGTWRLRASSPSGGIGNYSASVTIGAGVQREFVEIGGVYTPSNDSRDQAEDLNATSRILAPGIDRLASVGRFTPGLDAGTGLPTSDLDYFRFTLAAGQTASVIVSIEGSPVVSNLRLGLFDDSGDLAVSTGQLVGAAISAPGADRVILDFTNHGGSAITLYARPRADTQVRYSMVVTRGATFDIGQLDGLPQALGPTGAALGMLQSVSGSAGAGAGGSGTPATNMTVLDGTGFRWDVNSQGVVIDGTSDAYDGGLYLRLADATSGLSNYTFNADSGLRSDGSQTLTLIDTVNSDLRLTRQIYVPGNDGFARYLDQVTNTSTVARTLTLSIDTNLGSDSSTRLIATDAVDLAVYDNNDHWLVTDDVNNGGDPSLAHISWGAGGLAPAAASLSGDNLNRSWTLTVLPGKTVGLLHFAVQAGNEATVQATAQRLVALPAGALTGLSVNAQSSVVNFALGTPDEYRVWVNAGDALQLHVAAEGAANLPFMLRLIDPDGVLRLDTGLAAGPLADLSASLTAASSGAWTVQVVAPGSQGEYLLKVDGATGVAPAPRLVSSSPAEGAPVNGLPAWIDVTFDQFIRSDSAQATDLVLDAATLAAGATVTSVEVRSGRSLRFHLSSAILPEAPVSWTIAAGALTGHDGQGNLAAAGQFVIDHTAPQITGHTPLDQRAPLNRIVFTVSETVDPASVSAADVLSFTGPTGNDLRGQITGVTATGNLVTVLFNNQFAAGTYLLSIGPDVRDLAGNLLDQDGDGIAGEPVDDVYSASVVLSDIDLVVDSVDLPPSLVAGSPALFSWTVRNAGTGAAQVGSEWYDRVQLIGPGGQVQNLGDIFHSSSSPLAVGDSYGVVVLLQLPLTNASVAGNYRVQVITDIYGQQTELNNNNNTLATQGSVALTMPDLADLVIQNIVVPASVGTDTGSALAWTTTNQGLAASNYVYDRVELVDVAGNLVTISNGEGGGFPAYQSDFYTGPMAAGGSTSHNQTVYLPANLPAGQYRWRITTDFYGYVVEQAGEANNVSVSSVFTVGRFDLHPTSISAPASINMGSPLTVTWHVDNIGDAAGSGSWYDRISLVNPTTGALAYSTNVYGFHDLAVGAGYDATTTFTVPFDSALANGDYIVRVDTDAYQYRSEGNEANNSLDAAARLTIITPATPDLLVTSLVVPTEVAGNTDVTVSWTVLNQGPSATASAFYDRFYLVAENGSTTYLGDAYQSATLASGASVTRSLAFRVPYTMPVGNYRVRVDTDAFGYINELPSEGNNTTLSDLLRVTASRVPDLQIQTIDGPAAFTLGQPVTVTWTGINTGISPIAANAVWYDTVSLVNASGNVVYTVNAYMQPAVEIAALTGSYQGTLTFTPSIGSQAFTAGNYRFRVTTDAYGYVAEANENNNALTDVDLVALSAPLSADLQPAAIATPTSVPANTRMVVTWEDHNTGAAAVASGYYDLIELVNSNGGVYVSQAVPFSDPASIAAGGTAARSLEMLVPVGAPPGSYRLRITTDYYNQVPEYGGETNNGLLSTPFTVTEALRAALTNVRLDQPLPASVNLGSPLSFSYTVDNAGTGSTQNVQWYDYISVVRASDPGTVIASQQLLAGSSTTGVPAGGSYSRTVNLPLPLQAGINTGEYLVKVLVDRYNYLNESNRADNELSTALHLAVPALANLVVTDVVAPATATSGLAINVSWTTANTGNGDLYLRYGINSFVDRVWLADINGTPLQNLGDFQVQGPFPAGTTLARVQTVTLPDTVVNGDYTIVVETDINNYINEQNGEADNRSRSATLSVAQPPRVDLQVDAPSVPATADTGTALAVQWVTRNAGLADFAGGFNDRVQISTSADFSSNVRNLAPVSRYTGAIATGGSVARSTEVLLPIDLNGPTDISKTWYVRVVTDINNEVYEYNLEGNNTSAATAIVLSRPALPDLVVATVDAPDAAVAGTEVVVTYTVTNNGTQTAGARQDRIALNAEDGTLWTLAVLKPVDDLLAPGASQTLTARFTLPVNSGNTPFAGRLRAQVTTDYFNAVVEYPNDNNNTLSELAQTVVTLPPLPNLLITDISVPLDALTEELVPLRWTLTNNGTATAGPGWVDRLYLSTDGVLDGSDRYLGDFAIEATLGAGQSLERVQNISLPRDLSGTFRLIVITDINRTLFEGVAGEADNQAVDGQTITIRQRPLPNLVVTSVTPPENAFSGQLATVNWTVRNIGTGASTVPVWHDAVYLSLDDVLDNADTQLAVVDNPGYLDINGSYANTANFTLPRGIDANYRFIVVTDVYSEMFEGVAASAAEHDNASAPVIARVTLTPPPDLIVTDVSAPPQAFSGEPITVTWQVQNNGDGPTRDSNAWYDRVWMSLDNKLDAGDTYLGDVVHNGALAAGNSYTGSYVPQLPIGVTGSFHFIVSTDIYNQVYEHTAEGNNARAQVSTTQILLTPPPDLEIVSSLFDPTARAGTVFNVHYRVENLGASATPERQAWWYDQAWLSLDDVIDGSDIALGSFNHYGVLDTDAGYDGVIGTTLGAGMQGSYKVLLRTDGGNQVFETDNANNTIVAGRVDIFQSRPDLVVSNFTMPASVEAGRTALFSWTVSNTGNGDSISAGWTDSLWASLDNNIGNGDDVLIGSVGHAGVLASGASYTVNVAPVIPFALAGTGHFYVRTDVSAEVTESNEGNNLSATVVAPITRREPDLVVTSASVVPVLGDVRSFDLHFVVRNDGIATTNANAWTDGIWLSANDVIGAGDTRVQTVYRGNPLAPGDSYSVDLRVTVPTNLSAGNYKVLVRADDDNVVIEGANENNNVAVASVTLGGVTLPAGQVPIGDLTVLEPDLIVASVDAPEAAFSGQQVTIRWTTRNQKPDAAVTPWYYGAYDQVFLSSDLFLDSSDLSLGYVGYNRLDGNSDAQHSLTTNLPVGRSGLFYVLVKADAGNAIAEPGLEANNLGYDPALLEITLAPPADLVAGTITLPANAAPGLAMDVTYTVSNASANSALGAWRDTLYLSKDDVFDLGDTVFGSVDIYGPVAGGSSYTRTVHATVPGVNPGDYKLIVRSDVRNVLPELSEANNLSASINSVALDVPELAVGVATSGSFTPGQALFFKVNVGAGEALRIKLDGPGTDIAHDMFVGFGSVPSRSNNDVGTGEQFTPDPVLTIPTTQAGVYYVRIDASQFVGGAFSIRADLVPFSVERVSEDTIGNRGEATVRVDGARFDADTRFELVAADGSVYKSVAVSLRDAGRAYVTFDTYGAAVGAYDLRAVDTQADGSLRRATLAAALKIVAGEGADAFVTISGPTAVQINRDATFQLNYSNDGDGDTLAPLLIVKPSAGTTVGLSSKTLSSEVLFLLGASLDGPTNLLRPGARYSMPVAYKAPGDTGFLSIEARPVQSDSSEHITDWSAIERSVRPANVDFAAWQKFWGRVQPAIGNTMGDLVQVLNDMLVRLSPAGDPIRDVRKLFAAQLAADPNWVPAQQVIGTLLSSVDASAVAGGQVQLVKAYGSGYRVVGSATTAADGSFAIAGVRAGTYYWALASGQFDQDRNGAADTVLTPVVVGSHAAVQAGNLYRLPSLIDTPVVRQDSNAQLIVDGAGVVHMLWQRGDLFYHAYRGADGNFIGARSISEVTGASLKVAASNNLVAGQPGLIAVWEQGTGNATQIWSSVGMAAVGGGYVWSKPIQITHEAVASYSPSVEIDGSGKAVITFLRRDFSKKDDGDLYHAVIEVDPGALVFSDVSGYTGKPAAQDAIDAIDAAGLEPLGTTKISVGYPSKTFGPYEIAGFSFQAGFEGTVSSTLDDSACTVADSLTGKGSLAFRVPEIGRAVFEGQASGTANWYVDPNTQDWKFSGAQIDAAASGKLEVKDGIFKVLQAIPATAPVALGLRKAMNYVSKVTGGAVRLENAVILGPFGFEAKDLRWSTQAPFPSFVFPDSVGEFSIGGEIGLSAKAVVKSWDAEISLEGRVGLKAKVYPSFQLDANYTVSLQAKVAGWVLVNGEWADSTTLVQGLESLDGRVIGPADSSQLIFVWDPAATLGTTSVYGTGAIDDGVATNRVGDSQIELTRSNSGVVSGLFARDGDAFAGEIGNRLMVTTLSGGQWSNEVALPDTLGFNSEGELATLADGSRLALWSHASNAGLTTTSAMDLVMAARKQSDLYFSIDTGAGFSPATRITTSTGSESDIAVARGADGRTVMAWVNDSGSEQVLYTATWTGSGFGAATEVARSGVGGALSGVTIAVAGNQTLLAWNLDVDAADDKNPLSLQTATLTNTQAAHAVAAVSEFETKALASAFDKVLAMPVAAAAPASSSLAPESGWPVFAVPEDCKKCTPAKLKKISEAAPDCRPGGGSTTTVDTKKCEQKTITYAPCVTRPRDPNDIIGPDSFGDQHWVKASDVFDYTIRFENAADATAPAQVVTVTQTLDADLDARSFRITGFGFGEVAVTPSQSRSFYSGRIDLRETQGIYVDVAARIDTSTRVVTYTFTTIDPATGEVPADATLGFLLPNNASHRGDGFVSYSVKALRGSATGAVIDAQARIVFDSEGPIDTPPISHTLDAGVPSSQVAALPATSDSASFSVRWSGTDAAGGSAIRDYEVYVSTNGGAFALWQVHTTDTEAVFDGTPGNTYAFYSVARDNAGNIEAAPASADASIRVLAQTGSVAGAVFNDINFNGVQDVGEGALAGWTVFVDGNGNNTVDVGEATALSGADGSWQFADLQPGAVRIAIEQRAAFEVTSPVAGYLDVTITAGGAITGREFGVGALGSISGVQFDDTNGNGQRDAGEAGLAGFTVFIDANANSQLDAGERSTVTAADGSYVFAGLRPGAYQVAQLARDGWIQTRPGLGNPNGSNGNTAFAVTLSGSLASISLPACACGGTVTAVAAQQAGFDEQLVALDKLRADPGYAGIDGTGIRVVVIDTGIDASHPFFNGRIVYQYDFADHDGLATDNNGHGTHVAGVIAGADPMFGGVAPGADLIVLKVFGDDGNGSFASLEQALQWVLANADAYRIGVVNLSLGDGGNWTDAATRYGLGDEFAALAARNIISVAAAGNNFASSNALGVAYPANDPAVLAVGAVWAGDFGGPWRFGNGGVDESTGSDHIASFSQRDPDQTDIFAPGARLTSAAIGGGVRTMQGTSQSAAYVSGVAALAQQLAKQHLGRSLSVAEFHDLLVSTAVTINDGDDEHDNVANTGLNFPRLDVKHLADAIMAMAPGSGGGGGQPGTNPGPTGPIAAGPSLPVTVAAGQQVSGADLGMFQLGQVGGTLFDDRNGNGNQDAGEAGIAGATLFVDANHNGSLDDGEATVTTGTGGHWQLTNLRPGSLTVAEALPAGWARHAPEDGSHSLTVTSGLSVNTLNFSRYDIAPVALDDSASTVAGHSVAGNVLDNDSDPGRADKSLLVVSLVSGPAHGSLTLGPDGAFSYAPTNGFEGSDSFRYAVTDGVSSREAVVSLSVLHDLLRVEQFTGRHDGFEVVFSRAIAQTALELGGLAADVVVSNAANQPVAGSLFIAADGRSARFIASGSGLADGIYSVRLRAGSDALRDLDGVALDGDANGSAGGDHLASFTVARGNAVSVGLADTARGPGQVLGVGLNDTGLAIKLSNGAGVTAVSFTLTYDPALLGVATLTRGSGLPAGASFSATQLTAGQIVVQISAAGGLPAGVVTLGQLVATVPAGVSYGAAQILDVRNLLVNAGALASQDDDAVHVAAYVGDMNRDRQLSVADVTLMRDLLAGTAPRLAGWPLLDGRLLGDVNGSGAFDVLDPQRLEQALAGTVGLTLPIPGAPPVVVTPPPPIRVTVPPKVIVPKVTPKLLVATPSWVSPLVSASATIDANTSIRVTI